jgi:hypothetical protein
VIEELIPASAKPYSIAAFISATPAVVVIADTAVASTTAVLFPSEIVNAYVSIAVKLMSTSVGLATVVAAA